MTDETDQRQADRPQIAEPHYAADSWQGRLARMDPTLHVHLIGISGAGLNPIAAILQEAGLTVSGSDIQLNAQTERLAAAGVTIYPTQTAENLAALPPEQRPDVVLISSAVGPDNPERQTAEALGIAVVKRQEFLPPMLVQRKLIAVAGSHGKSTTTAMIVHVLREAGIKTGYIIGSQLPGYGNASAGKSDYFVLEADEYDHMFLGLMPTVAVITNVEWDHPDCYTTPASFRRAFMQFTDQVQYDGLVISCGDDNGAEMLRAYAPSRGEWITYGLNESVDLRARHVTIGPHGGYEADLCWWQAPLGRIALSVPGIHNLWNAMAALAVARYCDIDVPSAMASLGRYQGIARRFELKGEAAGVTVIDDYAHHPTEIQATLAAARNRYPNRRIWAVFQPHTYSRTAQLLYAMADSFEHADAVIVTDIYAARERDDGRVRASEIVAASDHPAIRHISGLQEIVDLLAAQTRPGDVVITLGAGTSYKVGEWLLEKLRET